MSEYQFWWEELFASLRPGQYFWFGPRPNGEMEWEKRNAYAEEIDEWYSNDDEELRQLSSIVELKDDSELRANMPELVLSASLVIPGQPRPSGTQIQTVALPWFQIVLDLIEDPRRLFDFAKRPRRFEEFVASAYERAGWDEVILTPPSRDGGRDVIASKRGFGSIRILEQTKAYSKGHLVTHADVRAMIGVLTTDPNSSKAIITTTSDFQPGVLTSPEFRPFMPYRLELKNGPQLIEWLKQLRYGAYI